jgi:hypothetical protein
MVKADLARGVYLDPAAGKVTLGDYARTLCAAQTFDETTREAVALRLRLHVVPQLGAYPLAALRPSVVQHGPAAYSSSSRRAMSASCSPT